MYPLTPWVKRLLIANVVVLLVQQSIDPQLMGPFRELVYFPFRPDMTGVRPDMIFKPWTVVTYTFLHAGFGHLFFNMIGLFFFGPRLEERIGGADFLKLYFLAGFGGALLSFIPPWAPMVGASGAVFGVLAGFAYFWPRERLFIFPLPVPIEAWLMVTLWGVASLWMGFSQTAGGIAHFAHLGGLVFGLAYLKARNWRRGSAKREFQKRLNTTTPAAGTAPDRSALKRWEKIDVAGLHELNREEVQVLLEKARTLGPRSLTQPERQFLDRMAAASGA